MTLLLHFTGPPKGIHTRSPYVVGSRYNSFLRVIEPKGFWGVESALAVIGTGGPVKQSNISGRRSSDSHGFATAQGYQQQQQYMQPPPQMQPSAGGYGGHGGMGQGAMPAMPAMGGGGCGATNVSSKMTIPNAS
eukprot:316600-Pyramimonas_sp.AAC.1